MNILVIGGTGYISPHMVRVLLVESFSTLDFDNLSTGHNWAVSEGHLLGAWRDVVYWGLAGRCLFVNFSGVTY